MKLDKLAQALMEMKTRYDVDGLDLLIINTVLTANKQGDVPVMSILQNFTMSAQATTHNRLTRLVELGVLAYEPDANDRRVKNIVPTDLLDEMLGYLGSV